MSEFLRFIILNIGRITGMITAFFIALLIVIFGFWKALFIIAATFAGFFIGRIYDDGFSLKKTLREMISGLRVDKWHS
jgi:uncharacterized membrane protein